MATTEMGGTLPSVCPLDCPDTCSLSVRTDGTRVLDVRGSKANPYTAGVICSKVARSYPEFVHGPARLTRPLKRTGRRGEGAFAPISWDEALDLIHAGIHGAIARHGPQAVLPLNYAGPHGELAGGSMDRRFFHRLGASLLARGQLCGIVRGSAYASLYGAAPGMPPEQMRHSDLIVVWSNNVTVSNLHLAREIKAARRTGGARLIVIDPKRTRIAEQADLFIQIRPGTDVVLALAMAAELERLGAHDRAFMERWVEGHDAYMAHARAYTPEMAADICGVDRASFDTFAQWYRDAKTVGVSVGNGMERGRSGGSGLRAAMALQALTGNHGRLDAVREDRRVAPFREASRSLLDDIGGFLDALPVRRRAHEVEARNALRNQHRLLLALEDALGGLCTLFGARAPAPELRSLYAGALEGVDAMLHVAIDALDKGEGDAAGWRLVAQAGEGHAYRMR